MIADVVLFLLVRAFDARLDSELALPTPIQLAASMLVGGVVYLLLSAVRNREGLAEVASTIVQAVGAKGEPGTSTDLR